MHPLLGIISQEIVIFVALTNDSVDALTVSPTPAVATFSLLNDGTRVPTKSGEWLVSGSASSYEAHATWAYTSGSDGFAGTTGTWLALSASRSWTLTSSDANVRAGNLTVSIRDVATSTVQATAVISMSAEMTV